MLIKLKFSRQVRKNAQIPDLIKISPGGDKLFHADGQTDGRMDGQDKANSRVAKFCKHAQKL
jgi:hypothetical protein